MRVTLPHIAEHSVLRAPEGAHGMIIAELMAQHKGGIVYIACDDQHMNQIYEAAKFFAHDATILKFPAWDTLPYDRISPRNDVMGLRLSTLATLISIKHKSQVILLTTINAWMQRLVPKKMVEELVTHLEVGENIGQKKLIDRLIALGFHRADSATEPSEFAVRGSLVDIMLSGTQHGFRLDFFGDTLESIRSFDPMTQRTLEKHNTLTLVPASEVILNSDTIRRFREKFREMFGVVMGDSPLYDAVSEGRKFIGLEHWLPLFYESLSTGFDFADGMTIVMDIKVNQLLRERLTLIDECYEARKSFDRQIKKHAETRYYPIKKEAFYVTEKEFSEAIKHHYPIIITSFTQEVDTHFISLPFNEPRHYFIEAARSLVKSLELLKLDIAATPKEQNIRLACLSEGSRSRLMRALEGAGIETSSHFNVIVLPIERGFIAPCLRMISELELTGERIVRGKDSKKKSNPFREEAGHFLAGEYVVHRDHGIGRFESLEHLKVLGVEHDVLKLVYEGGDRLYVPVENMELISRYSGEESIVSLDKLGGVAWQKRKAEVKKRIREIAGDLIRLAAARSLKAGDEFPSGYIGYTEFCARFPYSETEDQQRSIHEVEADLSSGRAMDRLVCGDVGFGKTEVALRAAFLVAHPHEAVEKAQVAIITPTTLLCRQHFKTFTERFSGTGVRIAALSRLVSARETQDIKRRMKEGEVDIVVGTHALLSQDVNFKKLGLIIVDEEQHFGVVQKEKLKALQKNAHVLTLTATPIPRTLQMSLSGIRDMSVMATPPVDRLAVRTYIMPFDPVVIREAIMRELQRGGRVFYVCPRIEDLDGVHETLKNIVPEIKVAKAHGQMKPEQLDEIMTAFYDGSFQLLLSTTIIESGLDIPSANTIIIHRADMFGLSQLYQLRGRVGRSKVRAYAYLTMEERRIPTPQAVKRLEVMQKLDNLGAGFLLASHDMDIRGFGNLLGEEQSGQVKEVGVELYQEMLREAVEAQKAGLDIEDEAPNAHAFSPQINLGIPVLIPESYVPDLSLRMGLYRRLSRLENEAEIESIAAEMVDRFGTLPKELENLLAVLQIKIMCRQAGIDKLDAGPKGAVLSFYQNRFKAPEKLLEYIRVHANHLKIRPDQKIAMVSQNWENEGSRLKGIKKSLAQIAELAA